MQLDHNFYRLPFNFDFGRLEQELQSIDESEWTPHPQGYKGNDALLLITVNGEDNHYTHGPMRLCPRIEKLPYIKQVAATFNTVVGRCRIMRLAPGQSVDTHCDINSYWRHRMRIHVPITTDDAVKFYCDDQEMHMAAGESWVFNTWKQHKVINASSVTRTHLVIDTVGSLDFWHTLENQSWHPKSNNEAQPDNFETHDIAFNTATTPEIVLESYNLETIKHPSEIDVITYSIIDDLDTLKLEPAITESVTHHLKMLSRGWRMLWSINGSNINAITQYQELLHTVTTKIGKLEPTPYIKENGSTVISLLQSLMDSHELNKPSPHISTSQTLTFDRPIIILSAPRAGSTLLFETLSNNQELWHINDESHGIFESIPQLKIENNEHLSNILTKNDYSKNIEHQIKSGFISKLVNNYWGPYNDLSNNHKPTQIRLLEKTPKNALRIEFLSEIFPDARFIFLYRKPEANISSIIEGWKSGNFVTYPQLPNWNHQYPWSYLLPKGWQDFNELTLADIANFQYQSANQAIINELSRLESSQFTCVAYEDFIDNKYDQLKNICEFSEIPFGPKMQALANDSQLPLSRFTVDPPSPEKWKKNELEMQNILTESQEFYQNVVLPFLNNRTQKIKKLA